MGFTNSSMFGITQHTDEQLARFSREANSGSDIKKINKQLEEVIAKERKIESGYIKQQILELEKVNKSLEDKIIFYDKRMDMTNNSQKIIVYEEQIFELTQQIEQNKKQILEFEKDIKKLLKK